MQTSDRYRTVMLEKYHQRLHNMAKSGGGGFHTDSLGVANLGREAGLGEQEVFADIRLRAAGDRAVPDREIRDTVRKAFASDTFVPADAPKPVPVDAFKTRHRYVEHGREKVGAASVEGLEAGLRRLSPVSIPERVEDHGTTLLASLFNPDECLFIGDRHSGGRDHVKPAAAWIKKINTGCGWPHFIINPLTGREDITKDGRPSLRSDSCVASFRHALAEFDRVPKDEQLAFWVGFPAPVAALIDSGGKSVHALIRVDCEGRDAWERDVEQTLFRRLLIPLGVDSACRNEARLSRMPGHLRADKGRYQRLLYLNPAPALEGIGSE